ncbi:alpha/beta fold hydrolase [Solimonas terrae]|uniref:Alpha/beta fold hydrolase n=1 Tax=Solimonas terrae TaxID=1396819 RepID=A0A6M2BLD6_9GAMM|nr:alpha/beta fold hydrolase [Solimonas terrae]NGY03160.1 alpha/beta fold hydrolase [Solimonas terrae]
MPMLTNDGVRLHWEARGAGSPLLLIMGHRYSARMWYPALDALAASHRVISFDNRGTGDSGYSLRVTIPQMARDALAVMDAAGVESAHVYGVSMGGGIAQELAVQQPTRVRSLILGCTALWSFEKLRMPKSVQLLYYLPPPLLRAVMAQRRGGDLVYGRAARPAAIERDQRMIDADPHAMLGLAAQAGAMIRHVADRERIAGLTMPALVLHGDEDPVVAHEHGVELATTLPNARLVTLEGAGHNYYVAAAETANREVLAFLERADA